MININGKKYCENCFCETDKVPCPQCGFDRSWYKADPSVLTVGSVLENRYIIGGVIGKGGFGITYLAFDMKLECKVAIKEYYPYGLALRNIGSTFVSATNAENEEIFKNGAEKFYSEARLVAKFNGNPNIVNVYDFFYENDTVYFTMGFLKGQTLKEYIDQHGALTPQQAITVANDVSNALMAAHSMNVLHRDISPDNIMICDDGTIKLLDFGAARQIMSEGSQSLSVILKQGFAPLEQYQKKGKQGPWTDIYSLGATLYYALTLELLDDPMSRLEGDEEYSSNSHNIPDELWKIIKKATELKKDDRYQNVQELKKDLQALTMKAEQLVIPTTAGDISFISAEDLSMPDPDKVVPKTGITAASYSREHTGTHAENYGQTMPLSEQSGTDKQVSETPKTGKGQTTPQTGTPNTGVGKTMPLSGSPNTGTPSTGYGQTMPLSGNPNTGYGQTMPLSGGMGSSNMQQFNGGATPNPPQKNNTGLIIGISVGVVVGLLLLILGIVFVKKVLLLSDSSTTDTTTEATTTEAATEATTEATTEAPTEAPTIEASSQEQKTEEKKEDKKDDKKDSKKDDKSEDPYADSNYIIPNSDVYRLSAEDIMNMNLTLQEINYAKNEIYARHGRKFKSKELSDYFNSQPWYKGTIDPDKFSDSMLSATESANAKLLSDIEFGIDPKGYQLDK